MLDTPVEVKKAYKEGIHKKNYRFVVLNDDGTEDFTIDNDTLVAESVSIDERMATGSELKFGLCEGSSLQFEYFDHENINGRRVQAFIDIEYDVTSIQLTESDNVFTVENAGSYQVLVPANSPAFDLIFDDGVFPETRTVSTSALVQTFTYNCAAGNTLEVDSSSAVGVTVKKSDGSSFPNQFSTPLGFFEVKECPRQFSTGIYKATCYNKLQSDYLDAKANLLIDNISSDTFEDGVVTSRGIMDALLDDFFIDYRKPNEIDLAVGLGYRYDQRFDISFSMGMQSYSNAWLCATADTRMATQDYDNHELLDKRVKISALNNYVSKLNQSVAEMKAAIQSRVSNPTTFWNYLRSSWIAPMACSIRVVYKITGTTTRSSANFVHDDLYNEEAGYVAYTKPLSTLNSIVNKDIVNISLFMPSGLYGGNSSTWDSNAVIYENSNVFTSADFPIIQAWDGGDGIDNIAITIADLPEVTLREIASSNYELHCQYGQLDRETDLFSGVELNGGGLYPAETLYPANSLYPNAGTGGEGIHPYPSEYSQLWTDTMGEQSFRYLIITYKTLDENNSEVDAVLQRTVNANGTTDYNMSDNWLFRNLVWTAADVGNYADAMVTKMQDIRWFPFEMWAAGLPYVETGDAIEITDRDGNTHNSYILQRQLQGIQNLQDTYVNGELDIF